MSFCVRFTPTRLRRDAAEKYLFPAKLHCEQASGSKSESSGGTPGLSLNHSVTKTVSQDFLKGEPRLSYLTQLKYELI